MPLTTFVGREREIREVRALLRQARLVSLTGAGGSGKTRLALEVVSGLASESPDSVTWVDLAPLSDPALLTQRVSAALQAGGGGPPEALVDLLRDRAALLVMDSCEHLVDACARLVEELLVECPRLRVLLTTREALGIGGEHAWHLPPLSLPEEHPESAEALLESEAARLFLERARAVRSDFRLTDENADAVATICRTLDGVPLAIELAAARIRVLSAELIARRLDDAFRLLADGSRTAIPRHRTLRAAIDWSYDLLSPEEQAFLPRLSVFRGGFSLSAAEEVCAGPGADSYEVLDLITRLVDRSLVEVREGRGAVRYHLLETVRQYTAERLAAADDLDQLGERHARFYLALAEEVDPFLRGPAGRDWAARLLPDADNLRQALAWTRTHAPPLHVSLVAALGWFWFSSRHRPEGERWLEGAFATTEPLPKGEESGVQIEARARVAFSAGALACLQGRPDPARPRLERAVSLAAGQGDRVLEAYARTYLALADAFDGAPAAGLDLEAAADAFRNAGESYGLRLVDLIGAAAIRTGGDEDRAKELGEAVLSQALIASRALGQDREVAITLQAVARQVAEGDPDRAASLLRESLQGVASDGRDLLAARGLELLGRVEREREPDGAAARLLDAAGVMAPAGADLPPSPAPPAVGLHVKALGPLEIRRDGELLDADAWRLRKPRELLVYLLCHPHGRTREQIGSAFWPGASPAQTKNSFHVTLHHLRKALGGTDRVIVDGGRYRINPELPVSFDVTRFERELDRALRDVRAAGEPDPAAVHPVDPETLRAALDSYRGEFLEDEGPGEWHLEHRDRLRSRCIEGLLRYASLLLDLRRHDECAEALERVIRADDLREDAHRALMICEARRGRRSEALLRYDHLVSFLHEELDASPESATTELADRIRGGAQI